MPASRRVVNANFILFLLRCAVSIIFLSYFEDSLTYRANRDDFQKVVEWLEGHSDDTGWPTKSFYDAGVVRLEKLCMLTKDEIVFLSGGSISPSQELEAELNVLKRQMILKFWLQKNKFEGKFEDFLNAGLGSLDSLVSKLEFSDLSKLLDDDQHKINIFWKKVEVLRRQEHLDFDSFPVEAPKSLAKLFLIVFLLGAIVVIAFCVVVYLFLRHIFRNANAGQFFQNLRNSLQTGWRAPDAFPVLQQRVQLRNPMPNPFMASNNGTRGHGIWQSLLNWLTPHRRADQGPPLPFNSSQTKFEFSWKDNEAIVGEMRSFTVRFYSMFVVPCQCRNITEPRAEITVNGDSVPLTMEESSQNSYFIKFTPTVAGEHEISFHANGRCIKTFYKRFLPAAVEPSKTKISIKSSIMVLKPTLSAFITLDECDKFGNKCESSEETLSKYMFAISEIKDDYPKVTPAIAVTHLFDKYVLMLTFNEPGCYKTSVTYQDCPIANNEFTLIVLTEEDWERVTADTKRPSLNVYFESYLLCDDDYSKRRKVYIYLTSKQLCVKEFYLKIFPKRLHTLRVRTTSKLSILPTNEASTGYPLMSIDQPGKAPMIFACRERNLLIATYAQLLLRKIGGSANFESKREHLYSELKKIYEQKSIRNVAIKVTRDSVLSDSIHATKGFSDSDWGKQFTISFIGEDGLDYGGPRREWFQILCNSLFKPENFLFCKSGKDDAQSLIHPNPFRPESHRKLKYYEFAGKLVGKMLIECAFGRLHYVNARFSRAFLCQIIGLDVSWRLFESDDKELYKTKIDYILKNDPGDLELTFTEDVYDEKQKFIKTVELKPYGKQIYVTESNKMLYLDLVADYRLAKSVKDEIASFLKGLNALVPENLLSIFDENELELLICGTEHISPLDLKENFIQCAGGGSRFEKVLAWFWDVVFGFSQEEMARLLQFTTGSSQLPPEGFKDLAPKFQINFHPDSDVLPTAHTCFNMLCLPDYSSKNELKKMLLIALNEGSEGFGLA